MDAGRARPLRVAPRARNPSVFLNPPPSVFLNPPPSVFLNAPSAALDPPRGSSSVCATGTDDGPSGVPVEDAGRAQPGRLPPRPREHGVFVNPPAPADNNAPAPNEIAGKSIDDGNAAKVVPYAARESVAEEQAYLALAVGSSATPNASNLLYKSGSHTSTRGVVNGAGQESVGAESISWVVIGDTAPLVRAESGLKSAVVGRLVLGTTVRVLEEKVMPSGMIRAHVQLEGEDKAYGWMTSATKDGKHNLRRSFGAPTRPHDVVVRQQAGPAAAATPAPPQASAAASAALAPTRVPPSVPSTKDENGSSSDDANENEHSVRKCCVAAATEVHTVPATSSTSFGDSRVSNAPSTSCQSLDDSPERASPEDSPALARVAFTSATFPAAAAPVSSSTPRRASVEALSVLTQMASDIAEESHGSAPAGLPAFAREKSTRYAEAVKAEKSLSRPGARVPVGEKSVRSEKSARSEKSIQGAPAMAEKSLSFRNLRRQPTSADVGNEASIVLGTTTENEREGKTRVRI